MNISENRKNRRSNFIRGKTPTPPPSFEKSTLGSSDIVESYFREEKKVEFYWRENRMDRKRKERRRGRRLTLGLKTVIKSVGGGW